MEIIELIIDEENEFAGIEAVSIVENPAIEEDFIALNTEHQIKFAEVDSEKRILMGAALVPNRMIYRRNGDREYYVHFSRETVRRASELFFIKGNHINSTLEHDSPLDGMTVVESWIIEDPQMDKSKLYGMDLPVGTWMISMKVDDEEIWSDQVKTGSVKGFSIEGFFVDSAKMPTAERHAAEMEIIEESEALEQLSMIRSIVKKDKRFKKGQTISFESYNDYPDAVVNNAKKALERNEKNGGKCMTLVGKNRATDLSKKRNLSLETLKRTKSYLSRAQEYYDESDSNACGTISFLGWGGKAMLRYCTSKLKELGFAEMKSMKIDDQLAIIDDQLAFKTPELANAFAEKALSCVGHHEHEFEGETWYMPCNEHQKSEQ